MKIEVLFIVLIVPAVLAINISHFELSQEYKNLGEAFKIIRNDLRKVFHTKGCILLNIADPKFKEIHEALKLDISKYVFNYETIRQADVKFPSPKQYRFSVILVDNMKVFRKSERFINAEKLQYSGYHIIILLESSLIEVQEIFTKFWSKNIYNVYVLMNFYNETLLLTFKPFYSTESCGKVSVKIINKFQNGRFINKLGPWIKFHNLNQCPVTVTTFTEKVSIFKQTLPNGQTIIRGYEYEMIQYIAEMLNFTLDLVYKEGSQEWGVVFENGTCTRGFDILKERKTDILLGDLYLKELRLKYFDASAPYLNYPLFFILPSQPKLNMLQKLLSPYELTVWILVALYLSIGVSVILLINLKFKFMKKLVYGDRVHHVVTNLYTTFIGQPQIKLPKNNFARLLLMSFLIYSLVIRNAYQGSLYKFLQSDGQYKEPQTIAELIDKKYKFIIAKTNIDIVKKSYPKMFNTSYIMEENDQVDLDVSMKRFDRTASFASKITLMNYSLANDYFPYKICQEHFVTFNVVMFYNKNFFLKTAIDDAIRTLLMHGFMDYWIKQYDKTDKWKLKSIKPKVITFNHLSGSFSLLLIGTALSVLVFVVEILHFKWKSM
ncbi:glutamate receptor ionotropic, NMDA 1-like [Chironomus tepperi]|uniref:glutamate receptor ionotropic, NMDA 1-like n=1 Tax=Chironomus tepperi TaxID=113505 RepID=UPI00391F1AC4